MKLLLLFCFVLARTEDAVETSAAPLDPLVSSAPSVEPLVSSSPSADPLVSLAPIANTGSEVQVDPATDGTLPSSNESDYRVCRDDAERLCASELASHDRSSLCECMRTHLDELTPACATFVRQKKAEREAAKAACGNDVAAFCPEAYEQGHWALRQCMAKHFHQLSPSCSQFIQEKMDSISSNACDNDVSSLCASSVGFSATLTCLKDNMQSVSSECRRFLWKPSVNGSQWSGWRGGEGTEHENRRDRWHHGGWHHSGGKGGKSGGKGGHSGGKGGHSGGKGGKREGEGHEWKHGWMKEKWGKKHDRKMRHEQGRLAEYCGQNQQSFCADSSSVHDTKDCLALNYAYLDKACREYLISSSSSSDSGDDDDDFRRPHHIGKLVFFLIGFVLLASLCCVCKHRCKHRRQWREMQRTAALSRAQGDTRYIAVPTTVVPLPGQVTPAQIIPTAPQPLSPQPQAQPAYSQGVVYAASPYTGGVPVAAVPVAYNPQAMSTA